LVDAFSKGAGWCTRKLNRTGLDDYPLSTHAHAVGIDEEQLDTRDGVRRAVKVKLVHRCDEVEKLITEADAEGQCVCWICNTVTDAFLKPVSGADMLGNAISAMEQAVEYMDIVYGACEDHRVKFNVLKGEGSLNGIIEAVAAIDVSSVDAEQLAREMCEDGYREHQQLWQLFEVASDATRDFLFRRERSLGGFSRFYLLFTRKPRSSDGLWRVETKEFRPIIQAGQQLAFVLRVNPTVTRRDENGKQQA
jgi:hypothetical protein